MPYKWRVAMVAALGLFLSVLDNTIVSVALPQMQAAFKTDYSTITWVATGYLLAQAAVIPIAGYLSDRFGDKVVYVAALAIFTLASLLCALAPTEGALISFRMLQGVGGGALYPTAFALCYRAFPPVERGAATSVIGVPVLLAPAFGPVLGGYLTSTFDWHAIFIINLPFGVVALVLAVLMLHGQAADRLTEGGPATARGPFDVAGLVLAMVGFTVLIYGISQAGSNGWTSPLVDRSLVLAVLILACFIVIELRVSDPVLDVRLFLDGTFTKANLAFAGIVAFYYGMLFLVPYFFENVQGRSPLAAGELLIGQGVASAVGIAVSGELYNRVGPRLLASVGAVCITLSLISFTSLTIGTTGQSLQIWLVLRGLGLGLTTIPLQNLALSVVSNRAMNRASSLVTTLRMIATALGVAGLGTYVSQQAIAEGSRLSQAIQTQATASLGNAVSCVTAPNVGQREITQCLRQYATVNGLNAAFTITLVGCAICILLALVVGRDPTIKGEVALAS